MPTFTIVAGARPNFMKIAPIIHAILKQQENGKNINFRLVHTGQHYDKKMSGDFFEQLNIPEPHANLGGGGGTQAEQTASIMVAFEKELMENPTDLVIVVGDVTSTLACSIAAKKLCIDVAHVEGGIRSGDLSMPEEINRMVTDSITDHFFTTSEIANENLRKSGFPESKIHFVGNTMIDTLMAQMPRFQKPEGAIFDGLEKGKYFVMTMHRPANVDQEQKLKAMIDAILEGTQGLPIIFPVHPRTAKNLQAIGIDAPNLHMCEPLGYLEFNYLVKNAKGVITDSGGITEEASIMNVPCVTLRDNTERPETIYLGTNELVGTDPAKLRPYLEKIMNGDWKQYQGIPMWDGKTADRIVSILMETYQ
ncbi:MULTISPECIES: UDP-N-acetylglucosamine 2-epimerase (non-hydrolyzing) [unclassified Algoriphagus]|jgi:UDP-N-acetylglucosamine 2-epimerase (non-hydrolysing)|uniref:non-hydrolyzing UDP-N-acetylglucosamine 2-epimerase n=2 Tax=Algoriphagus TaxID=246875 RepID=UPI000C3BEED4|nr:MULTISPECIES: UDP-N-acetylglucosamine 2-epimerase (non-hydrolyzing) [unclassified Algoriphagus]MAL15784.1 UDP-N-acetylglucosamine 2-epimerase (non-hydrolyzing) [Algoriphagus sp.]MAN86784.1 UDP-N-acetylglucosamine 2-epimerase (non-hydrolyzing) [Algoriphagus sp.]QYH40302.1 UDP-N-acetylglucosamine 2-epimerase (non-hydrolyzing) [Algoriphagus sp. NBT04N3]HAS57397.1 UDP-N-acetylglucosamine 2-epimerase (non-hydrolyzing) [Algoriphagus sp.]HCB45253.1 UDP-N-acetylglucosamine 2-epimerase (non-hydrolyz